MEAKTEIREKNSEVLNDLIMINNDRINCYEKAAQESGDSDEDLRELFKKMAGEGRVYAEELKCNIIGDGSKPKDETTLLGGIYNTWIYIKSRIFGTTRKDILESCECMEDAAQRAYRKALESNALTGFSRRMVNNQKIRLMYTHDKIRRLCEMQVY